MFHTLIVVGNLGKDPEMRYTPSGQPVITFPVAANRRMVGQNGQSVQSTIWFRVTVWGKQAEACNEYLHKGNRVLIEGHLNPDPATGNPKIWGHENKPSASYEVTAETIRFLSSKEDGGLVQAETDQDGGAGNPTDNNDIPF